MGFLKRRLVRYLLLAVAAPLLGALAVEASERMEAQRGASPVSTALRKTGNALSRTRGRRR
jgi:hypothetical protein